MWLYDTVMGWMDDSVDDDSVDGMIVWMDGVMDG